MSPLEPARRSRPPTLLLAALLAFTLVAFTPLAVGAAPPPPTARLGRLMVTRGRLARRVDAARRLGASGDPAALPLLRRGLRDRLPALRGAAAAAVAALGLMEGRRELRRLVARERTPAVRAAAEAALARLDAATEAERRRAAAEARLVARTDGRLSLRLVAVPGRLGAAGARAVAALELALRPALRRARLFSVELPRGNPPTSDEDYTLEAALTKLERRRHKTHQQIEGQVTLVLATRGGQIVMTTTGEAAVGAPLDDSGAVAVAEADALRASALGAHQNLLTFVSERLAPTLELRGRVGQGSAVARRSGSRPP